MASAPGSSGTANVASTAASQNYRFALIVLTSLFFMWGFLTCLNDILIPHLKSVFELNYTKAMLVQFCFFGAYFVVSYPAGALVKRVGYKAGIVIGLLVAALGCLLFFPAAEWRTYALFLTALFVLASGITILQVSANPYVTILGDPDKSSFRLTLTQAFNSLGTTVAPSIGSVLILGAALAGSEGLSGEALKTHEAQAVQTPYLILASVLALLAIIFVVLKLPKIVDAHEDSGLASKPAWAHRHLVLGAVGIFVYVGAEVAIGSLLVNFMGESAGIDEVTAGKYLTIYWMGAMIGRFIGAAAMLVVPAARILMFNAICAAVLVAVAIVSPGNIAMWALLGVGLFNSVMFPTIFSLALKGLGASTSQGSGILCMAIVGGAIIPLVQGFLADTMGLQPSFFLPILCYAFIAYFGLTGHRSQGE